MAEINSDKNLMLTGGPQCSSERNENKYNLLIKCRNVEKKKSSFLNLDTEKFIFSCHYCLCQ